MIPSPEFEAEVASHSGIAVIRTPGQFAVRATRVFLPGSPILTLNGRLVDMPSRFSVQVGRDQHLDAEEGVSFEESLDRYPWRSLNHSCEPNAVIRGRELFAIKRIELWEEICFDYNTSEFELATPFACACGARECCGEVRGFRYLSAKEKTARLPFLASYLRA